MAGRSSKYRCTVHLDEFSRKQVAGKFHDYILRFQPGCFAASGSGVIGGVELL